jgi:CheY-like chemotaxis protein
MPLKILLAEDDLDDQNFFNDCIGQRDDLSLIAVVENGEQVLSFLKTAKGNKELPDLILLDQNMPRQNGQQTLKLLKANAAYGHIPVFIYSTHIDERIKDESVFYGATMVMQKPSSRKGYHEMLERMVAAL